MPSTSKEPKPTVAYRADKPHQAQVGMSGLCYPVNHPRTENVTGDGETPVVTSTVVAVNVLTGEFWTRNTHYVPHDNW